MKLTDYGSFSRVLTLAQPRTTTGHRGAALRETPRQRTREKDGEGRTRAAGKAGSPGTAATAAAYSFADLVADFFAFVTRAIFALRRASRLATLRMPFAAAVSRFTYGFRRRRRRRFLMPFVGFW